MKYWNKPELAYSTQNDLNVNISNILEQVILHAETATLPLMFLALH